MCVSAVWGPFLTPPMNTWILKFAGKLLIILFDFLFYLFLKKKSFPGYLREEHPIFVKNLYISRQKILWFKYEEYVLLKNILLFIEFGIRKFAQCKLYHQNQLPMIFFNRCKYYYYAKNKTSISWKFIRIWKVCYILKDKLHEIH